MTHAGAALVRGRRPNAERDRRVAALRAQGLSHAEIGGLLMASEQAVQKTLCRLGAPTPTPSVPRALRGPHRFDRGDAGAALCLVSLARTPAAGRRPTIAGASRASSSASAVRRLLPEALRASRAMEVLQRLDTQEKKPLLEALAKGVPEAPLTQDAQAAFERLARRSAAP
jgi:hypothetical protein